MRNLKKILALVLALVMSLSLMAVASADDELNLGDVNEIYAESVDVLTGLKVFQGNKGEFLPKDNITRAEVAAIIYRIVTGDVEDTQKSIYADYNKFSDVTSDAWYAGYVNYCANAEYVKGVGGGKFAPQQNVTGYEALAMILRAIGYDRNNEFTGPSWQIQTAATARNRGILKNIAEGTLGGAATREVVAEILCQTILVPKADYTLAFGYRTTDANGKENPTLAYETFKMEKIDGVVMANEYASLTAAAPLPAGQTTLGDKTLNVTSVLDDIGESRYVYVIPQTGSTRYDLVCSKVYETEGMNKIYDNEGAAVSSVSSAASAAGISGVADAQHFINFDEITEYTATWRLEYVFQVKMSEYDAKTLYHNNGTASNSHLIDLYNSANNTTDSSIEAGKKVVARPNDTAYESRDTNWTRIVMDNSLTGNGSNPNANGYTYEYRKVINAGEKLTPTDIANIRAIFTSANYNNGYIQGEVYAGTNTTSNTNITINGSTTITTTNDLSDRMNYDQFVADYLKGTDNKKQVTSCGNGNHVKVIDNNNDGIAEYVLETIYTVAIVSAANDGKYSLDITGVNFTDTSNDDTINQVTASTTVVNDDENDLAVGNAVVYAVIDGNARAQLAKVETTKLDSINRVAKTATAGENTWTQSAVHTHSSGYRSGVDYLATNTTYNLYFDNYGYLAAYTEGANGEFVLLTDGWYNNTVSGPEYSVRAYIDGSIQTQSVTTGGSLFIGADYSNNAWNNLHTFPGLNNDGTEVKTIVANLSDGVLTPVDKMYNYIRQVAMISTDNNAIPGQNNVINTAGKIHPTVYTSGTNKAYDGATTACTVSALSNTVYYYVHNNSTAISGVNNNKVVRQYVGYSNIPSINKNFIEDVYVVGTRASNAQGNTYYTANVVVVELSNQYVETNAIDAEQVFIPDFPEVVSNLTIEQVPMIRESGAVETVSVNLSKSQLGWYDTADAGVSGVAAGLYYMTEDDTNPGTYIIRRMTTSQIRGNSYLTGFVSKSGATWENNWASVEMVANAVNFNNTIVEGTPTTAQSVGRLVAPNAMTLERSAQLDANTKYYTYKVTSGHGALTESTASVALAQNPDAVYNNTTNHYLNETYNALDVPRNEVLVSYAKDGTVNYVVSFVEYTSGTTRNGAQTVWYNNLVSYNPVSDVEFYGVEDSTASNNAWNLDQDNRSNVIAVTHAQALANRTPLSVLGATVTNWTIERYDRDTGLVGAQIQESDMLNDLTGVNGENAFWYRLTVTNTANNASTYYTLVKLAAKETAALRSLDTTKGSIGANNILTFRAGLTIQEFIENFEVSAGATVTWAFETVGDTPFTVTGKNNSNDYGVPSNYNYGSDSNKRKEMNDVKSLIVTVDPENGSAVSTKYFCGTDASNLVLNQAKAAAIAKLEAAAGYAETKDNPAVKAAYNAAVVAISSMSLTQLQNYTVPSALTDAIAAAKAGTTLVLGTLTDVDNVSYDGVTYGTTGNKISVTADSVTLGFNATTAPSDGTTETFIFTATQGSTTVTAEASIVGDGSKKDGTVTLTGLGAGEWTLASVKKAAAAALSFTATGATGGQVLIDNAGQNMLNGGSVPVTGFEAVTFTVTAPTGYQITSVTSKVDSGGETSMTGTNGTYTYTHANTGTTVTIKVTFEEVAAVEVAKQEVQKMASVLNGISSISSSANFKAALSRLNAATTQAEVDAAEADLKDALNLDPSTELMMVPTTVSDSIAENSLLSGGMLLAYDADAVTSGGDGVQRRWTLYGAPEGAGFTPSSTITADQAGVLNTLWGWSVSQNDLITAIFNAIKSGGSQGEWTGVSQADRDNVACFHYIALPHGENTYWVMVCVTNEGKVFTDNKSPWPNLLEVVSSAPLADPAE